MSRNQKSENRILALNFIGSKLSLRDFLFQNFPKEIESFADLFSGTGVTAAMVRQQYKTSKLVSNDMESFAVAFARAYHTSWKPSLQNKIDLLNQVKPTNGILSEHFSNGSNGNRMYFTPENASKIDGMRMELESWKSGKSVREDEYWYLLACIIRAADQVANTASTYAAYLKQFKASAKKPVFVVPIHKISSKKKVKSTVFQSDVLAIADHKSVKDCQVVYLDPPYNHRQYSDNYHILNVIAVNNLQKTPLRNELKTGLLQDSFKSPFCQKRSVEKAFSDLFSKLAGVQHLFMSYNSESMLSKQQIVDLMSQFGNVEVFEQEYKKFKSQKKTTQKDVVNGNVVVEYLFHMTPFN